MYKGYIYRHWIVNDKDVEQSYIGQVYNRTPQQRWGKDGNGYKPKKGDEPTHFYNAIQAYGWDNFNHKVLFSIECETLEELKFWLDEWEKYYIEKYDSFKHGYNSTTGGSNGIRCEETRKKQSKTRQKVLSNPDHYLHSNEFKTKMSEVTKGELNPNYGNGDKVRGEKNPFYGKQHNEEFKHQLSQERKGSNNPNAKKVICLNTNQVFQCIKDAKDWCGTEIKLCLYGRRKSAGKHPETGEKLHWMYYKDYLEQKEVIQ